MAENTPKDSPPGEGNHRKRIIITGTAFTKNTPEEVLGEIVDGSAASDPNPEHTDEE